VAAPNSRGCQWRFIVTDLSHVTTTWLDRLAMQREVVVTRGAPRQASMTVPSDNPEVNIPWPTLTDDAFVAEGNRFLIGFRREGRLYHDNPWFCRFAGLIMEVEDTGETDQATTDIVAYDPWKYMYRRPILRQDGSLPTERGNDYVAGITPDTMIMEQLVLAEAYGTTTFIDYGQAGDGSQYTGVIETCDALEDEGDGLGMNFPPGASIGEMFDTLQALGTCDIVLEPIYDPINRPGYLVQISILQHKGEFRPEAVVGWDVWPRNATQITRGVDGTERGNRMKFYASNNLVISTPINDAASIAKYGDYWSMQTFPGFPSIATAQTLGQKQLTLLANGQITYQLSLSPERAPMPFLEYEDGDTIPVYSSKRLRFHIPGEQVRVESIPVAVGEDDVERIDSLLVSLPTEEE